MVISGIVAATAIVGLLAPYLKKRWKYRKIKSGIEIDELKTPGVILTRKEYRVLPMFNIKIRVINNSDYEHKIRCKIYVNNEQEHIGLMNSTTERSPLKESFTLEPDLRARCFVARLVLYDAMIGDLNNNSGLDSIMSNLTDHHSIGPPERIEVCDRPPRNPSGWIEFIQERTVGVHGGNWTAKKGASIDATENHELNIVIESPSLGTIDKLKISVEEIVNNCKDSGWTPNARENWNDVADTGELILQNL